MLPLLSMPMSNPIVEVQDVGLTHPQGFALKGINFSLRTGEHLAIIGESGSGKSTLLKIIGGLLDAETGASYFEGNKVTGPLYNLIPGQKGIGYLSQHYELRNNYQVYDYLDYGSKMSDEEARFIFEACHIDHLLLRKTNSGLSGGEKQRIALAKILLTRPKMLLLDEPFSNIDPQNKYLLQQVLAKLENELKITYIMVSHDPYDLLAWAERIIIMRNGQLLRDGNPFQLFFNPEDDYTAGVLGAFNKLSVKNAVVLGLKEKDQHMPHVYIRPSEISMLSKGKTSCSATVSSMRFLGNFYRYELQWQQQMIIVHSLQPTFATGEQVYLNITRTKTTPLPTAS